MKISSTSEKRLYSKINIFINWVRTIIKKCNKFFYIALIQPSSCYSNSIIYFAKKLYNANNLILKYL